MNAIEIKTGKKGIKFAVLADVDFDRAPTGTYGVWKLCANYDGKVKGGIRHTWRYVERGLTLDAAKALLNRRAR